MNTKTDPATNTVEIFVVEDSPTQAEQLKYLLEQKGYRVVIAENGKQALALLKEFVPALVITDIIMPEMNGYDLCNRIKSDERTRGIPVILLTSLTSSEDVLEGLACGADNFVTKPYSEDYLFSSIEKILATKKLSKGERVRIGMEIDFGGKSRFITADQQQMLGLLISTYEAAIHRNTELTQARDELRAFNERLEDLVEERTAALSEEILERKRSEKRERHLSVVLRAIRGVNQLIVHARERKPLIAAAVKLLVSTRGFQGAWIILTDRLPGDFQSTQAGFLDDPFWEFAERVGRGSPPNCCQRAISEGGVVAIGNPIRECGDCPLARGYNGGAGLGVALVHGGRQFGCMGVSVPSQYANDEQEKSLLAEIAGDLAFGLHGMDVEVERKKSEQTLEAIFHSASDGILLADAEYGYFVEANDAICRMLGCSAEEIKRLSVADIHPIESMAYVRSQFERQARGEISLAADIPMKRRDGSVFAADVNSAPIEIGGRPHLIGIFRDITKRKQTEDALRESEERFRTLFEYAPDAYYLHDFNGRFIDGNRATEALSGYERKELIGKNFLELALLPPDDLQKAAGFLQKNAQGFPAGPDELTLNRKDGKQVFIEIRTFPIKIGDQDMILGIARNISERKNLEQQLLQSQKLEAIGRLTSGIAHDFNNLLTTIIGNTEMAAMDMKKDEPLHEILEEIKEAGNRAAGLTRQLLAFSRKQILQPEMMNINHVVSEMDRMLRRIMGEDIALETTLSQDLEQIEADVGQVEQILMNLAVNARDAMQKGGKLTIETKNVELDENYVNTHIAVTPGPHVMLAVSDTGTGMSREIQNQIFEPFFTTKEKGKGTGLGLSTVYGIVKQSNGNIWVYSEPGQGTTFRIYLPAAAKITSKENKIKSEKATVLRGTETILVVEDDESLRKMAVKALEKYSYTALPAIAGQEALQLCEDHKGKIHLMVTDVIMPGMSGKELADRLKNLMPDMKVLFMSGYTDNAIVHHGVLERGIAFLQKPFTPERLVKKVREVLDAG